MAVGVGSSCVARHSQAAWVASSQAHRASAAATSRAPPQASGAVRGRRQASARAAEHRARATSRRSARAPATTSARKLLPSLRRAAMQDGWRWVPSQLLARPAAPPPRSAWSTRGWGTAGARVSAVWSSAGGEALRGPQPTSGRGPRRAPNGLLNPPGLRSSRCRRARGGRAPGARRPRCHGSGPRPGGGKPGGGFSPGLPGAVPEIVPHASRQRGPGPVKRPPSAPQGEAVPALSLQAVGGEPGIALAPRASRSGARRPTGSHPSSALMGRAGACDRTCPRRGDVPQSWPARLPAV